MNKRPPEKPNILFLFSDTGGGHRSATEAIIEALVMTYGDKIDTEMVDIFKDYAPPPLDRMPAWYPRMVRVPQAWRLGYRLSDGNRRVRLITTTFWPYVRRIARHMVTSHPCNLIVSVHPLASAPMLSALGKNRPAFVTVVTDMVTTHALWYHRRTDLCLVPTETAKLRAIKCGLNSRQVHVVGLPVANRFCLPMGDSAELRARLGWPQNQPVILLVGGGDGMGPLQKTAEAIAEAGLPATLVVVAGRNQKVKTKLEAHRWPMRTFIYGFVREMPDFMRASDILVTKAGPGTISEAFNAGLPLVLYSRLPGQEDGNVAYVVSEGAGIWAPHPELIVSALRNWISHPDERKQAASACRRLARPQAAAQIAQILAEQVGVRVAHS
ncbi:MAG: galactosyldiacylglycerol synthase [Chloroflexota bacterium]|nr:MAG: galactosyldiacylglycerol synthase [Chloroflexota bacterium]